MSAEQEPKAEKPLPAQKFARIVGLVKEYIARVDADVAEMRSTRARALDFKADGNPYASAEVLSELELVKDSCLLYTGKLWRFARSISQLIEFSRLDNISRAELELRLADLERRIRLAESLARKRDE